MRFFKTNWLVKQYFRDFVWDIPTKENAIFLTFDDGPIPQVTEFVLETLEKNQAKATFFCVGDNIQKHPQIFKKLIQQRHSIGNHTFHHLNGWKTAEESYIQDIWACQRLIGQYPASTLEKPLFRPPYGKIKSSQFQRIKGDFEMIMWDVLSYDFDKTLDKKVCLQKAVQQTQRGSIVVFHDSIKSEDTLRYVLPRYIQHFKDLGYQFERL